ncbi:unnamed protein product [Amoebophrya sp. A120]|nr:unnamed protein product [Amoebophrya sp. A120]|eukprot:GSA120T00020395001.1
MKSSKAFLSASGSRASELLNWTFAFQSLFSVLFLSAATVLATTSTGSTQCPCTSPDLSAYTTGSQLKVTVGAKEYNYAVPYGTANCQSWDSDKPPACALGNGQALSDRPDWCAKQWCYVDSSNCASSYAPVRSTWLAGASNLYYSYATCGTTNSFSSWSSSASSAGVILTTVEATMKTLKREIERNYEDLQSGMLNQAVCSDHFDLNSCTNCPAVSASSVWNGASSRMNFSRTGSFMADSTETLYKCLHDNVEIQFMKVASTEYDMVNKNRIAYLYIAFADRGNYIQWPAMQWTQGTYDPRYRPWYAMIASGPKNVIIVIDVSGSMGTMSGASTRLQLAKDAAIKTLDTLVWVDYFLVIAFSNVVTGCASMLIPCSTSNVAAAKTWINGLSAGGTTNFRDSLDAAFDRAKRATSFDGTSDPDRCFSAQCKTVVLFLSDGVPDSWGQADYARLSIVNPAPATGFKLFTYALGVGADGTVLSALASQHGGEFKSVSDGGNLANTMADYYKKISENRDLTAVRWMQYRDSVSNQNLLAGCIGIDDKRVGQNNALLAVACMDANIIAPLSQLETLSGYTSFISDYSSNSRKCASGVNPFLEMNTLSCSTVWETTQVASPGQNLLYSGSSGGSAESGGDKKADGGGVVIAIIGAIAAFALLAVVFRFCTMRFGQKPQARMSSQQSQQDQNRPSINSGAMTGSPMPQQNNNQMFSQNNANTPSYGMQMQQFPNQQQNLQPQAYGGGQYMQSPQPQYGFQQNSPSPRVSGSPRPGPMGMNQNAGGMGNQNAGGGRAANEPMIVVLERN